MLKILPQGDNVRSGYIRSNSSYLSRAGFTGYAWSRSSSGYSSVISANAYRFSFGASNMAPSSGPYERYPGFPVRCLV